MQTDTGNAVLRGVHEHEPARIVIDMWIPGAVSRNTTDPHTHRGFLPCGLEILHMWPKPVFPINHRTHNNNKRSDTCNNTCNWHACTTGRVGMRAKACTRAIGTAHPNSKQHQARNEQTPGTNSTTQHHFSNSQIALSPSACMMNS